MFFVVLLIILGPMSVGMDLNSFEREKRFGFRRERLLQRGLRVRFADLHGRWDAHRPPREAFASAPRPPLDAPPF
jgi:hypothetical protein